MLFVVATKLLGVHADALFVSAQTLEFHHTVNQGVQGVVIATTHVVAGMDFGAALTNQDVAGQHKLTVATLGAQTLGLAVTTVARATDTFLMSK